MFHMVNFVTKEGVTMKLHIFEGTPEEIKAVLEGINKSDKVQAASISVAQSNEAIEGEEENDEPASVEFCRAVLGRRFLPDTQRKMYTAAYAAYPESLSYKDLEKELNYRPAQMAGFWGAHGRRVSHTEGYENSGDLFVWVDDGFCLTENMKQAVELENVVR
jgi:hypothetical protein